MQRDRSFAPRALLSALFLGLLTLALVPRPGRSAPTTAATSSTKIPADTVTVHLQRGDDLDNRDSPLLEEVRDLLELPLLLLPPRGSRVEVTRETLVAEYGSLVKESTLEMAYLWVWTGEHWLIICMGGASFELDFGPEGVVVVEAREGMVLGS